MTTGRRVFIAWVLGIPLGMAAAGTAAFAEGNSAPPPDTRVFDFGPETSAALPGSQRVSDKTTFTPELGYGWVALDTLMARERPGTDPQTQRAFVFSSKPHTLRVANLPTGRYLLTLRTGDPQYGDHTTHLQIPGRADDLPTLQPEAGVYAVLKVVVPVADGKPLDIALAATTGTWLLNTLRLEPTSLSLDTKPTVTLERGASYKKITSAWAPIFKTADPTAELIKGHRKRMKSVPPITPTGLTRADYLRLIAGEIDFWKAHQNADGAIIDPYRNVEFQYSTPAFAHAAAALVAWAGRSDLIEPAAKALSWSAWSLAERKAASGHEDFFAPLIAHAIRLLKPHVPSERAAKWEADIRRFNPFSTYRAPVGRTYNWNMVAACGEALFQKMGLRDKKSTFAEASFAGQGGLFDPAYGLYLEGPMAYDHFPRLWAGDLIAQGYKGPYSKELTEVLRRGAIASLFMQSPWGELPVGGRSAQHQWNEAEQCVTYEVFAGRARAAHDDELAAIFKRAAHLALRSMLRWVRPTGEMQIVKNWVDPAQAHAFETYSAHSQYNLLPMAMLAIAYEHAEATEKIAEKPAPAEVGGFTLRIDPLHKLLANVQGTYIEIDTTADHHYDATGLIRVHMPAVSPQIGPSDSLLAHPAYRVPQDSPVPPTTGIGVAWQATDGTWQSQGELSKDDITAVKIADETITPERLSFTLRYEIKQGGFSAIEEAYVLTPERVEVTTRLPGYAGPVRRLVPVLSDDGRTKTVITTASTIVSVAPRSGISGSPQTFTVRDAASLQISEAAYPNHNGWAKLVTAEYPAGAGDRGVTLVIAPQK